MKKKARRTKYKYVLWFTGEYGGWPTMNTKDNTFTSLAKAKIALKKHNRAWPEDIEQISIKRRKA